MQDLLKNKVIVISGGTKGIGKGIAIEAAKNGAQIVIGGRDEKAADAILKEIAKLGGEAIFVKIDLNNISDCEKLFVEAVESYGRIDGFVNYAGVTYAASVEECDEETFDNIFSVNFKAAFFCIKNAIKYMKKEGGSIVVFGSPHDDKGEKDRAAYACSKSALSALTTHVAKHYAEDKIRINYITMGWTPTEGELQLRKEQGIDKLQLQKMAVKAIPMGRMQTVDDHVPAVMYLLSDFAQMVTGANIRITGGLFF